MNTMIALSSPITLEYLLWWQAALLFGVLGFIILLLGMRSMNGLGRSSRGGRPTSAAPPGTR